MYVKFIQVFSILSRGTKKVDKAIKLESYSKWGKVQ